MLFCPAFRLTKKGGSMAMTIVNQSETGITYTLFASYGSGGVGSGAPVGGSKGSGTKDSGGSRGSGSPQGTASGVAPSGVAPSGVQASGSGSYTIAHDWMQAPGHTLSVSGG
jgi:hypothetical protein